MLSSERLSYGTRLRYAGLAGLTAWAAGWLVSVPFEVSTAWRYVDGHAARLPMALTEGLLIWAAFSLFMAVAGFLPVVLPLVLLVSPAWLVRWRWALAPLAGIAACLGVMARMHLLTAYYFHRLVIVRAFFFSAPSFFVICFAVVVSWRYTALVRRRLLPPRG